MSSDRLMLAPRILTALDYVGVAVLVPVEPAGDVGRELCSLLVDPR